MRSLTSEDRPELDLFLPLDEVFPFEPSAIGDIEEDVAPSWLTSRCSALFARLDPIEARLVRHARARHPAAWAAARFFNDVGAGWIYPFLALVVILLEGAGALLPTGCAALAIAIAQSAFPFVKAHVRRERPLAFDPALDNGVRPLDPWAWPSGHSVAAAAFVTPFVLAGLASSIPIALVAAAIFWSRLALAHHYPTDVLGGIALGAGVGVACWVLVGM